MSNLNGTVQWAGKVAREKIKRLYETDAQGISDEDLIAEVGWELWSRCDSILKVTAAHYGRVLCPACGELIANLRGWSNDDELLCPGCGWRLPWRSYHQTYQGKQLFGANGAEIFESYRRDFPRAAGARERMLLIDQLIHSFHSGLNEPGRPVGANLVQGSLKEVIYFLDGLTAGPGSAAGIGDSRTPWRRTLDSLSWSYLFIRPE
jgi:hypothetical protein